MSGNKVQGAGICGAKTRSGGKCKKQAGWGTDHLGSGRCRLHGGASTGAKTPEGKQKVAQNAIKHGAYVDRILNDDERIVFDWLHDSTKEKYQLDESNPMHMTTLHRACITYIKLMRLDEWELEEEIEPVNSEMQKDPETGEMELIPKKVYDEDGNVIDEQLVRLRRLRWSKNVPAWETHFQNYIKLLGVDRATEQKIKSEEDTAGKVVDAFAWLWGKQQEPTS